MSVALLPHLQALKEEGLTPLAVRVTLDQDNVSHLILIHGGVNLTHLSRSNMRRVLVAQLCHLPILQALTMSWLDSADKIITLATGSCGLTTVNVIICSVEWTYIISRVLFYVELQVPLLHSGSLAPGPLSLELLFHILDH